MRTKKIRLLALLLVAVMAVAALSACGKSSSDTANNNATEAGTNETESSTGEADASGERTLHKSANGIDTMDNGYMREDLDAIELTRLMGNGINLGNTMESGNGKGTTADVKLYETNWGQPETTQEMITGMKNAGFDSIRIPIAWTVTMDYTNGDYTIREDFFDRVETIINYALNEEMYVIINDHWDGGWWGMFGQEDQETRDQALEMYKSMWTQIATRYAEYSDYLIFESANEELGNRLNDEINGVAGVLTEDECYETMNMINQTFVDVVRGTGGNNASRFLLIAGCDTNIAKTCDDRFVMPTDTVDNKLLLSVHYYDPSNYCIDGSVSSWGVKADYESMNTTLETLTKFTEAGVGVIIGEWGVLKSEGDASMCNYYENFLNNCDAYGYCPVLWDCSTIFDRAGTCEIKYEDIATILTNHSFASQKDADAEELKESALNKIQTATDNAEEIVPDDGTAWIMFNSSDYLVSYAVGDTHPSGGTEGIVTEEPVITEAGTYTASIDFTGTSGGYATSFAFMALGIYNGETMFPGYVIDIEELLINGEKVDITDKWYTTSDDGTCTRLNLYNGWVSAVPEEARTSDGDPSSANPTGVVLPENYDQIETISVTFTYGPVE